MIKRLSKYTLFMLDFAIVLLSFLFVAKMRSGTRVIIANYWRSLIPFIVIWLGTGVWGLKYSITDVEGGSQLLRRLFKCDAVALLIVFITMFVFNKFYFSRTIVLGTILITVGVEIFIFIGHYYAFKFYGENESRASTRLVTRSKAMEELQSPKFFLDEAYEIPSISNEAYVPPFSENVEQNSILLPLFQAYLKNNTELFSFLNDYLALIRFDKDKSLVLNSADIFNIENENPDNREFFMNLHKINDYRRLNAYLIKVNAMLKMGGVFVCMGQTISQRKATFYERYTPFLGRILYFFDFIFRRVAPKLPIIQGWYFALTKGKNRALSETEILGRFYFCGFDLIHKREIDNKMHFILCKRRVPKTDQNPSYGPFIRLKRKGLGGKTIYIKKFRTMHPYSEYLQDYVYATNKLQEGGKFKDDFRITSWGKVLRVLWIDELPQILNLFAGELSLVGVRALSEHYFSLYPPDMQELRLKVKPGLLPPFYADMPKTFEEIVESERRYLLQKLEKPLRTDFKYFWKGVYNILIKRARSG